MFECGCGYSYTRSLKDGVVGPPRLRSVGPLLVPALRKLVRQGAVLRVVAREVGLDPKSVIREALSNGLLVPWKCAPSGAPRTSSNQQPVPFRQDRKPYSRKPRRDWKVLDLEMQVRVQQATKLIMREDPPVRVTTAEIERRLGRKGWLRKRRERLPMANAAMDELVETTELFQRRRILATLTALAAQGELPKAWKVMRTTGLTGIHLPLIEAMITMLVDQDTRRQSA